MAGARTIWTRTSSGPSYPALRGDLDCDVAVVGGGITGVTAAWLLAQAGRRVALLEAHSIGSGVTARTSAHVTEALDTRYATLESRFGRDGARLARDSQRAAIDRIDALASRLGLDCDLAHVPAYLYAEPDADASEVAQEYEAAARAACAVSLLDHAPLPFRTSRTLRFDRQLRFHPLRYVHGLLRDAVSLGAQVFEHSRVVDYEDGEPCVLETEHGRVRAADVFFATHSPLHRFRFHTRVAPYRSYVVAVAVDDFPDGLFFDTADPYHYLRRYDTDEGPVVLVGGEDHKSAHVADETAAFSRLEQYTRARLDFTRYAARWSAQLFEPSDGLPYVGRAAPGGHVFVATGFSGNGLTNGTMSALLVNDLILGHFNAWASLYDPQRIKALASAAEFVKENVDVGLHFVGGFLSRGDASSVTEVPPGEGRLVTLGGRKHAVYRAPDGELTALSPLCTHLYCHVAWNTAEKTWDCPCHGSRFAPTGEVLEGPARAALERRDLPEESTPRPTRTPAHPPDEHAP